MGIGSKAVLKQTRETNKYERIQTRIENICGSDMIDSKLMRGGNNRHQIYNLNTAYIKEHLKLNQYINPRGSICYIYMHKMNI